MTTSSVLSWNELKLLKAMANLAMKDGDKMKLVQVTPKTLDKLVTMAIWYREDMESERE